MTVIHRRNDFRAERILRERLLKKDNVQRHLGHGRRRDHRPAGQDAAAAVGRRAEAAQRGDRRGERTCTIDGVFVAIGHAPAVELFAGKLKQKPNGYLWTAPDSTRTDVPGVFAAGDVTDDVYRQAVTAAGLGCMAALEAEKYLAGIEVGTVKRRNSRAKA